MRWGGPGFGGCRTEGLGLGGGRLGIPGDWPGGVLRLGAGLGRGGGGLAVGGRGAGGSLTGSTSHTVSARASFLAYRPIIGYPQPALSLTAPR